MKHVGTIFALLALIPSNSWAVFDTSQSTCSGGDTLTFKVYDPGFTIGEVYAANAYDTCCKTTCTNKIVTGAGTAADRVTVTIPSVTTTTNCGQTFENNKLTVELVVLKTANVLETEDKFFTVVCDFSGGNNAPNPTITPVDFSTKLSAITAQIHPPNMGLYKAVGDTPVSGSLSLGEEVYIKITLPTAVSDSFPRARVTTTVAESHPTAASSINLLKANGCPEANAIFSAGFTGTGTNANFVAKSPNFKMFTFVAENGVVFKCTVSYCADGTANCDGNHCNNAGRRRRGTLWRPHANITVLHTAVYYVSLRGGQDSSGGSIPALPDRPTSPRHHPDHPAPASPAPSGFSSVPTIVWIGVVTILCATTTLLAMAVVYLLRARDHGGQLSKHAAGGAGGGDGTGGGGGGRAPAHSHGFHLPEHHPAYYLNSSYPKVQKH